MFSLQKILPAQKQVPKPGSFSIHQNRSVDNGNNRSQEITKSVDVNQQSLLHLQTQIQLLRQKTPSKYKSEQNLKKAESQHQKPELFNILENAKINPAKKKSVHTPKQNRKLNFNQITPPSQVDQDTLFLNSSNQMANMIIENILNKDEYYEKIRQESQEMQKTCANQQQIIQDLKKRISGFEQQIKELTNNLSQERQRYQNELIKINEKISSMKNIQNQLQMEQKKNELLTKQFQDQININNILKTFAAENGILCIDYLNYLQKIILSFQPDIRAAYNSTVQLLKHSTSIILEQISKTQELNLPQLKNCVLPEEFDVNGFFDELQNLQKYVVDSPELSFRQKSQGQSNNQKKELKNTQLSDQFNSFLDSADPIQLPEDIHELGSPYFTSHDQPMRLQDRFKMQMDKEAKRQLQEDKESRRDQMPMQMKKPQIATIQAKKIKTEEIKLQNFQSFNQKDFNQISYGQQQTMDGSENDTMVYDSLIKELSQKQTLDTKGRDQLKEKDQRSSSIHTLKYLDQQIQKEQDKQKKKNKENQSTNIQFVQAKYDYKPQKDGDLELKKGNKVKLIKKTNNGWWFGEFNGQTGYFPHNFVQLVD
ncbi:hypothetical protein pb186bvf_004722 [Paramecium bursaria]